MKLAEALLLRKEYQEKCENLQSRIYANLKVQEGEKPLENPRILMDEFFSLQDKLSVLIQQINRQNQASRLPNGMLLADALVQRELCLKKRTLLAGAVSKVQERDYRLTHSEVKIYAAVDVKELQTQMDALSKQYRELDTMIQGANWNIDMEPV